MKQDYIQNMLSFQELCEELREYVTETFYEEDGSLRRIGREGIFCLFPKYRRRFEPIKGAIEICDSFGIRILEIHKSNLKTWTSHLEDHLRLGRGRTWFEYSLTRIGEILGEAKEEIEEKIPLLDSEEKNRLNEAMHCFLEGCYFSAIAMSVSAIEFRLFSLMMSIKPDPKLEELTLGQLIREYLDNKDEYDNIIPKKHEPLLELCNIYRVFSVHPKKEKINKPIASSILNMTFMFLFDKKLIKKDKEASDKKSKKTS